MSERRGISAFSIDNSNTCQYARPLVLNRTFRLQSLSKRGFAGVNIIQVLSDIKGPGSSVGIATDYGLDGPGIESPWRRDFPHLSRPDLRPTQPPVLGTGSFPG